MMTQKSYEEINQISGVVVRGTRYRYNLKLYERDYVHPMSFLTLTIKISSLSSKELIEIFHLIVRWFETLLFCDIDFYRLDISCAFYQVAGKINCDFSDLAYPNKNRRTVLPLCGEIDKCFFVTEILPIN